MEISPTMAKIFLNCSSLLMKAAKAACDNKYILPSCVIFTLDKRDTLVVDIPAKPTQLYEYLFALPCIKMSETGQKIKVSAPWTDIYFKGCTMCHLKVSNK